MGANGGIGTFYNLLPELFVEIYEAATAGRWDDARAAQQRVNALIRITLQFPLFPAVKQMLAWSGLDCGACLPPRGRLDLASAGSAARRVDSRGISRARRTRATRV